jgi:hypothetical protein
LVIGNRYNWKNQPERLVYVGMCEPRNGRWHQFAKVGRPSVVWCEVLPEDLHMLEPTIDDTARLDWFSKNADRIARVGNTWYTRVQYGAPYRKAANLREAIDRSMEAI